MNTYTVSWWANFEEGPPMPLSRPQESDNAEEAIQKVREIALAALAEKYPTAWITNMTTGKPEDTRNESTKEFDPLTEWEKGTRDITEWLEVSDHKHIPWKIQICLENYPYSKPYYQPYYDAMLTKLREHVVN